MRYVLTGIRTTLSLRLRSVRGWAILLLLPLLVCAVTVFLPSEEVSAPVQVGVCLPKRGGEDFWNLLEARSGTVLTFFLAEEDEIDRNVAAGRWDCGLILGEDFEDCLEELETDRIFTLRISSGSVVYPLVRERVSACMAELISGGIAREYLLDSGIASSEAALRDSSFQLEVLDEAGRVDVALSTPDGEPLERVELAQKSVDTILRWMISAVILVWMLLSAADLGRWIRSPAARRMLPLQRETVLMLSRVGADALLALIAGCAAQLLLGGGLLACVAVACYVLFWMAAAVLFAHFRAVWTALPVCMPFLVVISLLLSGALVDVSWFLPALAGVTKALPVSLFLRACMGEYSFAAALLGMAALCLGASALCDKAKL